MAVKSGYFRSRLHVDLSAGRAERIPLADEFLERFIGGRGFGAKIVWDALAAHGFSIDPLGPENTLAIAGGPLTGMYLPSSGKCSFVTISPATGVYGDSSMGGSFGIELRKAGNDMLDITGRAPRMSFLEQHDWIVTGSGNSSISGSGACKAADRMFPRVQRAQAVKGLTPA